MVGIVVVNGGSGVVGGGDGSNSTHASLSGVSQVGTRHGLRDVGVHEPATASGFGPRVGEDISGALRPSVRQHCLGQPALPQQLQRPQ